MKVLIDSSVWSLVLRRSKQPHHPIAAAAIAATKDLLQLGCASIIGMVRQEVLSGIREIVLFDKTLQYLASLPDTSTTAADHVAAAALFNQCRAKGVQGTSVDLLLCAVAIRLDYPILTTDKDFVHYAKIIPIRLHPSLAAFNSED